ncbi:uncharacterized mitochondrial protein AtMg00810-like [Gossypium hirsutum]|uniref:Uncharacterized mitochondrial protein AtMg00810-like n=1 Tax=Gossypium hirsutum TaxID=3635 RepID=A0A1U8IZ02_GOSHI|nr:uncharacterized mitochondrial protein AtMg00810-like [Gossypium hirsutum]
MGTLIEDPSEYRSLVGALQYVMLTRPDITYAVNHICQFMHAPTYVHFVTFKRILHYLSGMVDNGLLVKPSKRLSLQQVVSCSTAEVEYHGLAAATMDVTWLMPLLSELQYLSVDTPTIWCDNSSVVAVAIRFYI